MKILIAEDEFVSRTILNKHLSAFEEVDIASNGKEALAAVKVGCDGYLIKPITTTPL